MQIFSSIDDVVHVFDHQPLFTRVAPENLKCGQDTISHPKKKSTGDKENATSKPKSKPKAKKQEEVVEQSEEEGGKTDGDE